MLAVPCPATGAGGTSAGPVSRTLNVAELAASAGAAKSTSPANAVFLIDDLLVRCNGAPGRECLPLHQGRQLPTITHKIAHPQALDADRRYAARWRSCRSGVRSAAGAAEWLEVAGAGVPRPHFGSR